jgi:hypothetical protein
MKKYFIISLILFALLAFKTKSVSKNEFYVAGYLLSMDSLETTLIGPSDVKWIINSKDVINQINWERNYGNFQGVPVILTLRDGTKIIDGDKVYVLDYDVTASLKNNCKCEVNCGDNSFCCAIKGYKTYCKNRKCIQTTEKCDE